MLILNSKSPSVEKKLTPVIEKNEMNTVSTTDDIKVTPSKILKTNDISRRPGPKSKTCVPQIIIENMTSNLENTDKVNPEQEDSNDVACFKKKNILLLDSNNSSITDTIKAESKKNDINTAQLNEAKIVDLIPSPRNETGITLDSNASTKKNEVQKITVSPINSIKTDNGIVKIESNEIKQTKKSDNFDTDTEFEEEFTIDQNSLYEDKNKNINIRVKEVTPEQLEEKKSIHNELDHEIYEELDHEVDGEEINESIDGYQTHNTEKSMQEHNKDDNNEDSINLMIEEDDINLFADEEDTNIEKEDEVIEYHTKEEASLIKQRESCHPVTTSSSRVTTGLVKSRRSATEKRSSVGNKSRSTHKEDKDVSNSKPIISVSVPKDVKKAEEKQVKDKVEAAGNKQSYDSNAQQISNDTSKKNNSSLVHNIWVSGLSSITKATDLKQLFSKYGKVVGAKVVTNAKTPGARCYGFVTLSSAEDANRSIENLHLTELHDRVISVERAKCDNGNQVTVKNADTSKVNGNSKNDQKIKTTEERKDKREDKKEKRPEITINDIKKLDLSTLQCSSKDQKRSKIVIERDDRKKERSIKSKSNERDKERLREIEQERECLEREKRKQQEILYLNRLKNERERFKQKEYERAMKEEERKRRIEKERQLETERKQKEEAIRLEKERQKLRIEREQIEKEKSELLRLERENQRLERERLQREKEELRRAQEKLEETKRQALLKRAMSPSIYNKRLCSSNSSRYEERKEPIRSSRMQPSSDYMNQGHPPPTITRHRYEQHSSATHRMRPSPPPPSPPASRPKDSTVNLRYGAQPATDHHYRSRDDRSDRRDESRRKDSSSGGSNRHAHTSYDSNKSSYGMSRISESNAWPSVPMKSTYNTLSSSSGTNNAGPDPWTNTRFQDVETIWPRPSQPPSNKWISTSSNPSSISINGRSSSSNVLYGNNHQVIPTSGLNMSTSYSDNRFDSYKMSGMSRKY